MSGCSTRADSRVPINGHRAAAELEHQRKRLQQILHQLRQCKPGKRKPATTSTFSTITTSKTFGIISAGYFYKNLQNPIVVSSYQLVNYLPPGAPSVDRGNYLATQYVNAGSAWLTSFETSYLQHPSNLPGFLGGIGMSANYSYIGSSTNGIPGRSDHHGCCAIRPTCLNISPTYDKGRYSLRMGIS